ncbi:uncharacterized protein [Paramormyrops kingsleyae]|uniref:uncharacterized protein isoform X2 n=1 Tax=Paramormyrops kingsleyae TaxID=1676925 RepID=UPI003B97C7B7
MLSRSVFPRFEAVEINSRPCTDLFSLNTLNVLAFKGIELVVSIKTKPIFSREKGNGPGSVSLHIYAMRRTIHPDADFAEGKRMALEIDCESWLEDARKVFEEHSRTAPTAAPKRVQQAKGVGKPRGRRGGRPKGSAAVVPLETANCFAEEPQSSEDPQVEFERNMEQLLGSLEEPGMPMAYSSNSTSSSWSLRQQKTAQQWKEARPFHLKCLLETHNVGHPLCSHCSEAAVIRCRECLPWQWFCGRCDVQCHQRLVLHNRESLHEGFFKPISPSTFIVKEDVGCCIKEQQCILPVVNIPKCPCDLPNMSVSPGKAVILISINGRYDLHQPLFACQKCSQQWAPDFQDLLNSGYWPASSSSNIFYTLDVFSSFNELKVIAPTLSRQAFVKLLEHRTRCGGRSGPVCGDTLQRSFLEYSYCLFEEDQLSCGTPLTCPACSPDMLAVSVDGNRKLYRFLQNGSADPPYFEGVFVAEDTSVSEFVVELHQVLKQTRGQGTCGSSSWTAAKETSRRTTKLDEEGMEVAVCRHGFLLKALNMYRGEIFAYPMYLHKQLMWCKPTFLAMDVVCKYWPYLNKAADSLPDLKALTTARPFLSVMHAQAHSTRCEVTWSGKNQQGAGSTVGEEVEQVNSYLSRCALTTKYMSKGVRVDMLTVHAIAWNQKKLMGLHHALCARYVKTCKMLLVAIEHLEEQKQSLGCTDKAAWVCDVREWAASDRMGPSQLEQAIDGRYLNLRQRKQALYRQNDSGKFRHRLRLKMAQSKKLLFRDIAAYNSKDPAVKIDPNEVELSLSSDNQSLSWPWEVHGSARIEDKMKVFRATMRRMRLEEEKTILVKEMAQHCSWLQKLMASLQSRISAEDAQNKGLSGLCRRRHCDISKILTNSLRNYRAVLGPQGSILSEYEEDPRDIEDPDSNEDPYSSEDEEEEEEKCCQCTS